MKMLKELFSSRLSVAQKRQAAVIAVGSGLMATGGIANAATAIDITDVLAVLAAAVIAVTSVCAAGLSIVVIVKVYKYVRAAF